MELRMMLRLTLLVYFGSLRFAYGDENEFRLIRDLSSRYDKRVRPSTNSSHPLNVTFGAALAQIIDVDERNQILTTNCWINQNWLDRMLSWDPKKYGGIKVIRLPHTDVWQPDILLYNNADVKGKVASVSTNVIVTSEGNVTLLSMVIYKSSCSIDVRYFPFDEQNCTLRFASWTYEAAKIDIKKTADEGDDSNYIENSEWNLIRIDVRRMVVFFSCCPDDPYIFMIYDIIIKRRPLFYLFNMVMPCILITLVALLGFYMPSDSGEKVSMGITTLLSITVFLMIVAESMPPTSEVLPLIGIYYGVTIVIVSSTTGLTVVTLNIHHNGSRGSEVPPILKKLCFGVLARILCVRFEHLGVPPGPSSASSSGTFAGQSVHFPHNCQKLEAEGLTHNAHGGQYSPKYSNRMRLPQISANTGDEYERQFMKVLSKVYQTLERNEIRLAEQDRRDIIKQEWQQLAIVVDRLLLLLFLLTTFIVTSTVLLQGKLMKYENL